MKLIIKFLRTLVYSAFALNLLLIALSISAAYLNPKNFWLPAFIKLFFPGWWLINLVFLLSFYLLNRRSSAFIATIGIVLTLPALAKLNGIHLFHSQHEATKKHLRIMTYNVMSFGKHPRKRDAFEIIKNIQVAKPDIVCMQEYLIRSDDNLNILDSMNAYGYKYYKEHILVATAHNYYFGLAIFSKYPLHKFKAIPFENSSTNGACYVDVVNGKDTLRIVNVHFQSFALAEREYIWDEYKESKQLTRFRLFKITLHKMRSAFRKKSFQTEEVEKVINTSRYPVILCGDFNDTPLSYTYSRLTENLNDSWLHTNAGMGVTFAANIPFLRIDYILTSPHLSPFRTMVIRKKASDHYPLVCDMDF